MNVTTVFPRRFLAVLLAGTALLLASLGACGKGKENTPAAEDKAVAETAEKLPAMESGAVVATVNGQDIHAGQVERVYENLKRNNLPPDPEARGETPEDRLRSTAEKMVIEQTLILQAAAKEGIAVDDSEVTARYNQTLIQMGGQEAFQEVMKNAGVTEAEVRKDIRDNGILRKYFTEHVPASPTVTPQDLRDFYDRHPEMFGEQTEVNAQHILLRTTPDMDDMAKAEVRKKAEELLSQIKGGADFGELATKNSEDPTNAAQGGDLGWFRKGMMVPPFEGLAFSLDKGQVGGPVETQFGYHLIKVNDKRTVPPRSFEEVQPMLQGYVQQEKMNDDSQALVDSLRSVADIKLR